MSKLKMMRDAKVILIIVFFALILMMCLLHNYVCRIQENNKEQVSELINYFEDILMLRVGTEITDGTPFEYCNDVDRYPLAQKTSANVKYNVSLDETKGEIRLIYTQNIYSIENGFSRIIHSAKKCPAIWFIEKRDNKWEVIKIAELDYRYGMSASEFLDALEILKKYDTGTKWGCSTFLIDF